MKEKAELVLDGRGNVAPAVERQAHTAGQAALLVALRKRAERQRRQGIIDLRFQSSETDRLPGNRNLSREQVMA